MTRRLLTLAVLGAGILLVTTQQATAFGFKRHNSCNPCPSDCAPPCSTSYTVTFVDKKVTAYKTETETKDVKVMVNEWVETKEDYKYIVCECVPVKSKVMVQQQMTKEEPYKYTVMTTVPTKEMVKVCNLVPVTKDVEITTYDIVPVVTKQKRIVCETICVPVTVTCTVPVAPPPPPRHGLFGGLCCAKKHDCDCPPPCPPTPCYETITKTVMQRQVVSKEIEVNVTTCTRVPKKVIQKVTTCERVWTEKEVMVPKCVPVEKTGTRTVCYYVPIEKEITTTTLKPVEKVGTRIVKKCVPVEKIVKQTFCKTVPYETTIKVPVYTPVTAPAPVPAPAPCATPCDGCGSSSVTSIGHRLGGGVLHGCCHKCK